MQQILGRRASAGLVEVEWFKPDGTKTDHRVFGYRDQSMCLMSGPMVDMAVPLEEQYMIRHIGNRNGSSPVVTKAYPLFEKKEKKQQTLQAQMPEGPRTKKPNLEDGRKTRRNKKNRRRSKDKSS